MLPNLWIFDTYSIMMFIGVVACLIVFDCYTRKIKWNKNLRIDVEILAIIVVLIGIGSAVLFQALFDALKKNSTNEFGAMTFYGGLVGGALSFILIFFLYIKRKYKEANFTDVLVIAPACITVAHAFGRIGCFCAGCCYGVETKSSLGIVFPGMSHAVYPTQLFESAFLFILSGCLFFLAYKFNNKYTLTIYLAGYGIFRFLIEFIRGDERGAYFLNLSPAQWFSIVAVIIAIILPFFLKKLTPTVKKESAN